MRSGKKSIESTRRRGKQKTPRCFATAGVLGNILTGQHCCATSCCPTQERRGSEPGRVPSVVEQARQERLRIIAEAEAKEKAEAAAFAEQASWYGAMRLIPDRATHAQMRSVCRRGLQGSGSKRLVPSRPGLTRSRSHLLSRCAAGLLALDNPDTRRNCHKDLSAAWQSR